MPRKQAEARADFFRARQGLPPAPRTGPKRKRNFVCGRCQALTGQDGLVRALHEADSPYYCEECWRELSEAFLPMHDRAVPLDSYYRRTYGISFEEYGRLYLLQRGRCSICDRPSPKPLVVDHDHSDGQVRGLLCGNCNTGLGMFGDDAAALARAITYLVEAGRCSNTPAKEASIRNDPLM